MKIITANPSYTEFSGENSVCDKPQLWAYVPYTLTKDNELFNNGDASGVPYWSSTAEYGVGGAATFENEIFISKAETNGNNPPKSSSTGWDFHMLDYELPAATKNYLDGIGTIHISFGGANNWATLLKNQDAATTFTFEKGKFVYIDLYVTWTHNVHNLYYIKKTVTGTPEMLFPPVYRESNVYFEYWGYALPYGYAGQPPDGVVVPHDPTEALAATRALYSRLEKRMYTVWQDLEADANRTIPNKRIKLPIVYDDANWGVYKKVGRGNIYEPYPNVKTKKSSGDLKFQWVVTQPFTALGLYGLGGEEVSVNVSTINADSSWTTVYGDDINLAKADHPLYLFGEESYHTALLIDHIPATAADINFLLTVEVKTADGDKDTFLGMVQPYNAVSLGLMDYAPVISTVNTTGNGALATDIGRLKRKLQYKTRTPSGALDNIVDALYFISKLSAEYSIPTLFIGDFPYRALQILGHMPTYQQALTTEKETTANLNIEEVTSPNKSLKIGLYTGIDESTPPPEEEGGGAPPLGGGGCSDRNFVYNAEEYSTDRPFEYNAQEYMICP